MKKIWHHYKKWEEYNAGMWAKMPAGFERSSMIQKAIEFTGDAKLYGKWMLKVIDQWPISCEHNLTDLSQNRRAWIGHAACCLAIGCPEELTRLAWGQLTKVQQDEANAVADQAINLWEIRYAQVRKEDKTLDQDMGVQRLC